MARTVLIVNDHAPFWAVARALLQLEGFAVVGGAADALSALDAVGRLRPDVVVLDIQLPTLTASRSPAAWLRPGDPPVIVLVSSRDSPGAGDRGGAVAYLPEDPRLAAADAIVGLPKSRYWIVSPAGRQ